MFYRIGIEVRQRVYALLFFVLCTMLFSFCGPIYETGQSSRIEVLPGERVHFHRVEVGSRAESFLDLSNAGDGILSISSIEVKGSQAVHLGLNDVGFPIEIGSGESRGLSVIFEPDYDKMSADSVIEIRSNDPERSLVKVEVISQQRAAQIQVRPSREEGIILGHAKVGEERVKEVQVYNVGDLPLELYSIELKGSDEFSLRSDPVLSFPKQLNSYAQDSLRFFVVFKPKDEGREEGKVIFKSNDPNNPDYEVEVIANSSSPCLLVKPSVVEFKPAVSVGSEREVRVQLESCSEVELVIEDVVLSSGNAEGVFSFVLKDAKKKLKLGEAAEVIFKYRPKKDGSDVARYTIISNDPLRPNTSLDVLGVAMNNQCPVAVARGRVSSSSEWLKSVSASPLDVLSLDGSLSHDSESEIQEWRWSIKRRPEDSTSRIESKDAIGTFFIDLAGEYEICLEVVDGSGLLSCSVDCILVDARPKEKIHIQLVWKTPKDKVINDNDGSDLDLHFLDVKNGRWGDTGNPSLQNGTDIYFLNQESFWQVGGGHTEHPKLDRDDKDGEGPENVSLDNPNPCRWYAIGVHYYQDNGLDSSYATIRVYISGKLRYERSNLGLGHTGEFIEVGLLLWDGQSARIFDLKKKYVEASEWKDRGVVIDSSILKQAEAMVPQCFKQP